MALETLQVRPDTTSLPELAPLESIKVKPPNWDRIQEIYAEAVALSNSERSAHVSNACAGDSELARAVHDLLKAHDSLNGFLSSPVSRLNPMPGSLEGATIAERYLVETELGHTAMSQVYLARDGRLQQQKVVIKILSGTLFEDEAARLMFDRELKTLLHLDHPNVVRVQDSGALPDGRPYFVMPFVDGETLRSQISDEGMDLERVALILKQVGAALDHVHENDILHRDLKPENIMLKRGTDSVILIDFGIAKVRDPIVAPNPANATLVGTMVYMSPEQLSGQGLSAASDIYSMGVVAYEMVTGRRPFTPNSHSHLAQLQREGLRVKPKQLRDELSTKADRTITRALSFEPKARYKTAGEFANRLAEGLLEAPGRPPNIQTWVMVGCGLTFLALLIAGIIWWPKGTQPYNRSFTYWLTVQEMFDGKVHGKPFQSNGDEDKFKQGDKFQLNVSSPVSGYLYIFNEGPPDTSDTNFFLIYPRSEINNGSSTVGSNQPVQSEWITFRGPPGAENFWIVWSNTPVGELESARAEAMKHARGGLTGQSLVAVKEFLRTKQAEFKATVFHYKATETAVARGKTDMLIALAQIKHR